MGLDLRVGARAVDPGLPRQALFLHEDLLLDLIALRSEPAHVGRHAFEYLHHVDTLRRLDRRAQLTGLGLERGQHRVARQALRRLRAREARRLAGDGARLFRGRGLGGAVAGLGRQPALDLRGDFFHRFAPAFLDLDRLDRVEAERRPHGLGRYLALLQREERLLELRHHLALADQAEIAAARRGRRILGDLLRELAEVRAGLRAPDDVGDLSARLVLALAPAGLGDADENMGGANLAWRLELAQVLLVELLDVGVGNL